MHQDGKMGFVGAESKFSVAVSPSTILSRQNSVSWMGMSAMRFEFPEKAVVGLNFLLFPAR